MTLDDVLKLIDYKLFRDNLVYIGIKGWLFGFNHYRIYYEHNVIDFYLNGDFLCAVNLDSLLDCKIF